MYRIVIRINGLFYKSDNLRTITEVFNYVNKLPTDVLVFMRVEKLNEYDVWVPA